MKRGFTLVELLAVIVILAIILVIAVPQITNVITQTKKNSLASTAKIIAAKAEEKEIENDVLGISETMTCASLVTLDDNYGNCTVTKSNGHWTVTIAGSGRFAGYSCTGTKSDMNCTESNTPEYVYSLYQPYYDYSYTVTDSVACKEFIKSLLINMGFTNAVAESNSTNICNNSNDVYGNGSNYSASQWISESIDYGDFTYAQISSFVTKSNAADTLYNAPVEDYDDFGTNVFIRWNGTETAFSNSSEKAVCIKYRGISDNDVNCFEPIHIGGQSISFDQTGLQSTFEINECDGGGNSTYAYIYCTSDDFSCRVSTHGEASCYYNGNGCTISADDGSVSCY